MPHDSPGPDPKLAQLSPDARVIDPVCGMRIRPQSARGGSVEYAGRRVYFCNPRCREKFLADPARYPLEEPALEEPATDDTVIADAALDARAAAAPKPVPAAAQLARALPSSLPD